MPSKACQTLIPLFFGTPCINTASDNDSILMTVFMTVFITIFMRVFMTVFMTAFMTHNYLKPFFDNVLLEHGGLLLGLVNFFPLPLSVSLLL